MVFPATMIVPGMNRLMSSVGRFTVIGV